MDKVKLLPLERPLKEAVSTYFDRLKRFLFITFLSAALLAASITVIHLINSSFETESSFPDKVPSVSEQDNSSLEKVRSNPGPHSEELSDENLKRTLIENLPAIGLILVLICHFVMLIQYEKKRVEGAYEAAIKRIQEIFERALNAHESERAMQERYTARLLSQIKEEKEEKERLLALLKDVKGQSPEPKTRRIDDD